MVSPDSDDDRPAKRLGRKLREARIAAGYRNQEEFGAAMNMHRTTVTKIESGARQVNSDVLRQWCGLCHVDFELYEASARLAWVAADSPVPVWFEDFFRAQILAHTIRTWHPIIIPGPLQTPDYARALHEGAGTPDDLIEDRVAARIDLQQQTIERRPVPVHRAGLPRGQRRARRLVHDREPGRRRRDADGCRGGRDDRQAAGDKGRSGDLRPGKVGCTLRPGEPRTHHEGGRGMQTMSAPWRKSSYSANGGQNCVEVADDSAVLVRDTTDRDGGTLAFSAQAWRTFVNSVK
jgi:transcriptional regulator with XRE-family HTH domain